MLPLAFRTAATSQDGSSLEFIAPIAGRQGYIFPYCPVDEAIRVRIDPVENSSVAALGNTHGQESNTQPSATCILNIARLTCDGCNKF